MEIWAFNGANMDVTAKSFNQVPEMLVQERRNSR